MKTILSTTCHCIIIPPKEQRKNNLYTDCHETQQQQQQQQQQPKENHVRYEVGIYLHKRDYELDARSLIRKVFLQYFGAGGGEVG